MTKGTYSKLSLLLKSDLLVDLGTSRGLVSVRLSGLGTKGYEKNASKEN